MPEFTDACSEICSTQEPRNGFSFSKIHHQVMMFCLVSESCRCEQGLCWGSSHTSASLCCFPKSPEQLRGGGSRTWVCEWGQHSSG